MHNTIQHNANAVIFPAFSSLQLSDSVKRFLSEGGCSLLLGETRTEYVSRQMSESRKRDETAERVLQLTTQAASVSGNLLVAVDQEIAGICRLQHLVEPFPARELLQTLESGEFEIVASRIAKVAQELGINCFLGPILDVVTGDNPWLQGRTWTNNPKRLAEISSAYIRGVQSCGIAAAAKHFPGYSTISLDPAVEPEAKMTGSKESIIAGLLPFQDAIENNVEIIMTGPAIVEAIDPVWPASLSAKIIQMLKGQCNFQGLVLSDDLDSPATLRGQSIGTVAVEALTAGADLLLVADIDNQIASVGHAIAEAVRCGKLAEERLGEAADKVRHIAKKYAINK